MNEEKTHWKKKYNYDYLGDYSLPDGKDIVLTIKSTRNVDVKDDNGRESSCFVCDFQENYDWVKPMILNRTNCRTIGDLYCPWIEDWPGLKIQIGIEKGVRAFGKVVDALRVRKIKPRTTKPDLKPNTENWNHAVTYMKTSGANISKVKGKYNLTKVNETKLKKEAGIEVS